MRLTKLILEQFRNHQKLEIDFDAAEPLTYIVGPNAQGKTNILEAIYLLALTKSFRGVKPEEMIGWDFEFARVQGFFTEQASPTGAHKSQNGLYKPKNDPKSVPGHTSETIALETFLGKPPHQLKAFKKNGVKTSATHFIGNCQVVFFHPEDLNMLYLGPDLRRAHLNIINTQINRKYFAALRSYHKVLKQRNALLKAIRDQRAHEAELNIWDEQLIEHGNYLIAQRKNTIEYFQEKLTATYQKISKGQEKVGMTYRHPQNFAAELAAARPRDLQATITTVGPHRDDFDFSFNGLRLAAHASRGEYRSLLLALKLIELQFFQERTGQNPLLLLDDVFSELDPQRQNLLLQAIEGHQTIITTTHLDFDSPQRDHHALHAKTPLPHGKYLEIKSSSPAFFSATPELQV